VLSSCMGPAMASRNADTIGEAIGECSRLPVRSQGLWEVARKPTGEERNGMTVEASGDANIDRRMQEVVGSAPRIAPLREDQLTEEAHRLAVEIRAAFGIPEDGAMPESLRMML